MSFELNELTHRPELPLIKVLATLPETPDYVERVGRALGPANYAHLCREWGGGGSSGLPCQMCEREGHEDVVGQWCYTDLVRLPYAEFMRLHVALGGVVGKESKMDTALQLNLRVALEIVHVDARGQTVPFILTKHVPDRHVTPLLSPDQVDGSGGRHYAAHQHDDRESFRKTDRFVLPLFNMADGQASASYILRQYGWKCRKGGRKRYRYIDRDLREYTIHKPQRVKEDAWRVAERAFLLMHPEEAPSDKDRRTLHISVEEKQAQQAVGYPPEVLALLTNQDARIVALQEQIARLAADAREEPEEATPRKRGRPSGSKNRSKAANENNAPAAE